MSAKQKRRRNMKKALELVGELSLRSNKIIVVNSSDAETVLADLVKSLKEGGADIPDAIQSLLDRYGKTHDELFGTPARRQTTLDDIDQKLDYLIRLIAPTRPA